MALKRLSRLAKRSKRKGSLPSVGRYALRRHGRRLQVEDLEQRVLLAVRTWDGGGTNDLWSNPLNWDGDASAPANNDDVVIPATADSAEVIFDASVLGTGVTLNSLSSAEPFRITGDTLTLDGAGPFTFTAGLTMSGGTIAGNDDFTISGAAFSWTAGTLSGSGTITVSGGASLSSSGTKTLSGKTLTLDSDTTWAAGTWNIEGNAVVNNQPGRTFDVQGDLFVNDATTNSVETFNSFGTLRKSSGTGTLTWEVRLNVNGTGANEGLVDVQAGTLRLSFQNNGFSGGTFTEATVEGAGTIDFDGGGADVYTIDGASSISISNVDFSGGTANIDGTYNLAGSSTTVSGGTANFNAGATVSNLGNVTVTSGTLNLNAATTPITGIVSVSGGMLNLSSGQSHNFASYTHSGSGTLTGSDIVSVTGAMNWNGGTITDTSAGNVDFNVNGGLTAAVTTKTLSGRTMNLNSNTSWTVGTWSLSNGAAINNNAGRTFTIQGDLFMDDGTGNTVEPFNNFGTVRKTAGAGTSTWEVRLNVDGTGANEGLVDIQTGTLVLSFQTSGFSGGTFTAATVQGTGAIDFSGGGADVYNFDAASSITIANVDFSAGTVNFNGTYNLAASTTTVSGGTANFNAAATVTNLGDVTITSGILNLSSGDSHSVPTYTQSGGTLTGSDVVTVTGAMAWNGGTITDTSAGNVDFNVNGGLTAAVTTKTLDGRTMNLNSNTTWTAGTISLQNQAAMNNQAGRTFTIQGDLFMDDGTSNTVEPFNNFGTLRKSAGAGTLTWEVRLNVDGTGGNEGLVDIQTGTLLLSLQTGGFSGANFTEGTLQGAGHVDFQAGASDTFNFDALSSITVNTAEFTSGTAIVDGTYAVPGLTTINSGTVHFNTVTNVSSLVLSSGTLTGSAVVNVTGAMTWSGGTITDSSGASNIDFNVNGGLTANVSTKTLDGRRVNLNSNTSWTVGPISLQNLAEMNNHAGQTFTVAGDLFMDDGTTNSVETFNNFGTVRKSAGVGVSTWEVRFNVDGTGANQGVVDIQTGTMRLNFQNSGFSGGTFTEASFQIAGTFDMSGGSTDVYNVNAGTTFTGAGVTQLSEGTFQLHAATAIDTASFRQEFGSTVQGDFDLTINGLFDWQGGTMLASAPAAATTITNGGSLWSVTTKTLNGRTLELASDTTWTAGTVHLSNNAVLNNLVGQTLDIRADVIMNDLTPPVGIGEQFNNFGTLRKSAGLGIATIEPQFTVNSTVEVYDGTLSFTGTFTNYDATTRTLSGGTYRVFAGGSPQLVHIRWPNTDIAVNDANILLSGPNAQITDTSNANALLDLALNTANGSLTLENGANLTVNGVGNVIGSFDASDLEPTGNMVSIAFDPVSGNVFIYGDFDARIAEFTPSGMLVDYIPVPAGVSSNDIDLDFAPIAFTINGVNVPANSLLLIDGLTDTLRALNKDTGTVLAQVTIDDGVNGQAVGGAYHSTRQSLFVVEHNTETIREINPDTGAEIASFSVVPGGSPAYTVNFGDIEVNQTTGNLFIVSSDNTRVRELTATGAFVQDINIAALAVGAPSGLALDDTTGETWITNLSAGPNVFHLNGFSSVLGSFDASQEPTGSVVSIAFDPVSANVFLYGDFDASIAVFTPTGDRVAFIPIPAGADSNDIDLDFAPEALTVNGANVPANSLLLIDGETDTLRALNKDTGAVLAQVTIEDGPSGEAVGGAYHSVRNTLFVVEHNTETIREINPDTGAEIAAFPVAPAGSPTFTVNFGDIEVNQTTGNLFVVSSDQTRIRELTPTGAFVRDLEISSLGISSMSGIAIDDATGHTWISTLQSGPNVYRLEEFLFENAGAVTIRNSGFGVGGGNGYRQTGGSTTLDNGNLASETVDIQQGTLGGNGSVVGNVSSTGVVGPGLSPGLIAILARPYLNPTPYLQASDSPFNPADFAGAGEYFHLETLKTGRSTRQASVRTPVVSWRPAASPIPSTPTTEQSTAPGSQDIASTPAAALLPSDSTLKCWGACPHTRVSSGPTGLGP